MRVKIPNNYIKFILDFFIYKKNIILTKEGLSDYYDVKIGIDQEEVISPLLWYIYFDPLLCEIDNLNKEYTLSYKWMSNISQDLHKQLMKQISALGFMDNTNWITNSLKNLEDILEVANDFYKLTRATINKEKSKLLTNTTIAQDSINICFSNSTIPI